MKVITAANLSKGKYTLVLSVALLFGSEGTLMELQVHSPLQQLHCVTSLLLQHDFLQISLLEFIVFTMKALSLFLTQDGQ